jgi:site-specific DNA recombinase
MTLSLAFVSPVIAKAAIDGNLPRGLSAAPLTDLPPDWDRQVEVISRLD